MEGESARDWSHIAVLKALVEQKVHPDIVYGISIGAFGLCNHRPHALSVRAGPYTPVSLGGLSWFPCLAFVGTAVLL